MLRCIVLWLLLLPASAQAGTVATEHAEAELISEAEAIAPASVFYVALRLTTKDGWHTYWVNPGDSGMATSIDWKLPEGFKAGQISWPVPERLTTGPLTSYGYEKEAYLLIPITPPGKLPEKEYTLNAKVDWLVCKDVCIPESAEMSLTLASATTAKPSSHTELFTGLADALPKPSPNVATYAADKENVTITFGLEGIVGPAIQKAEFFPLTDGLISNHATPVTSIKPDLLLYTTKKGFADKVENPSGILALHFAENETPNKAYYHFNLKEQPGPPLEGTSAITPGINSTVGVNATKDIPKPSNKSGINFLEALLYALLGGIILNIMPCVLPILSLKALAVVKKAEHHPHYVRLHGFAYTAGIILSFLLMAGLLIVLQQAGMRTGWAFQMQHPPFVVALAYLMFLVGLNLSGLFEFPVLFGSVGAGKDKNTLTGTFSTGILAVLVATPCTAPYMAPAIGYALTQPPLQSLSIFASLGLGLALPFLLISLFPPLRRFLPKPGAWMLTFKQFLAFPMYATAAWLVWVANQQVDAIAFAFILGGLVIVAFSLWVWRFIAPKNIFIKLFFALILGSLCIWPLTMLGTTPAPVSAPESATPVSSGELETVPYSDAKLKSLLAEGRSVFVDATAAWCITCKVNERVALDTEATRALFIKHKIVFMVADWTNQNDEITRYLQSFGREGVPLYVFYHKGGEPHLLPQVLTEAIVKKFIEPQPSKE